MKYQIAAHSDVGIKKSTNQDSILIETADSKLGEIAFGVICDGMGGLEKGEVASAILIEEMAKWFESTLPVMIDQGTWKEKMKSSWEDIIIQINYEISSYGKRKRIKLGTTIAAVLIIEDSYYVINVGDSRVYRIQNDLQIITKDQTYVQSEIDANRMTEEEARKNPKRNVLLQCIGASDFVVPDFFTGKIEKETNFMLCSDGFRHVLSKDEIYDRLNPYTAISQKDMEDSMLYLTELNKYRREEDNISVAVIGVS